MMIKNENGRIWQESMEISRYCVIYVNFYSNATKLSICSNLSNSNFNHVLKYVLAHPFTIKFVQ